VQSYRNDEEAATALADGELAARGALHNPCSPTARRSTRSAPCIFRTCLGDRPAGRAGAVLVDRSRWGRIRVSGDDRLKFLHGQSTADFLSLAPGQGTDTVGPPLPPGPLAGRAAAGLPSTRLALHQAGAQAGLLPGMRAAGASNRSSPPAWRKR